MQNRRLTGDLQNGVPPPPIKEPESGQIRENGEKGHAMLVLELPANIRANKKYSLDAKVFAATFCFNDINALENCSPFDSFLFFLFLYVCVCLCVL